MKTLTCAFVLVVILTQAQAEEVWITFQHANGNLVKARVIEKGPGGVKCQVGNQYETIFAWEIVPQDRERLGFKEEEATFRGLTLSTPFPCPYGVWVMKDGKRSLIRSAEMTAEERKVHGVREPEEAKRIEAELDLALMHRPVQSEASKEAARRANDALYERNQISMKEYEARQQQLKAEEAALKAAQAEAQRKAQIEAQRLAEERMIVLKEQQLREREIAAQERIAAEMARIRQEMEIRRVILGR